MNYFCDFLLFSCLICNVFHAKGLQNNFKDTEMLKNYIDDQNKSSKIISGKKASLGQFPWQVALNLIHANGETEFCGGSLISPKWVLTASHCVVGIDHFVIILGIISLKSDSVGSLKMISYSKISHEDYNEFGNNDIALIELPEKVQLSDTIDVIKLPGRSVTGSYTPGVKVTTSGWGKTNDENDFTSVDLNYVELEIISNEACSEVYGSSSIIDSTICVKGHPEHSPCNGDSGGPLVLFDAKGEATLVGIVSFVHESGCSTAQPSAFVRTGNNLDWIKKFTGIEIKE